MTTADPRFSSFILSAVAVLGLPEPDVTEDRYLFKVDDRWVEVKFDPRDGRATFASLVYVREAQRSLSARFVADFNCNYLFNGGYALVPVDGALLYLCRPCRLDDLDAQKMRTLLEDFMNRSESVAIWCLNRLENHGAPPSAIKEEQLELIRV